MRIAICSDESYAVHATVRSWLEAHGHEIAPFGSVASGSEVPWALAGIRAPLCSDLGETAAPGEVAQRQRR